VFSKIIVLEGTEEPSSELLSSLVEMILALLLLSLLYMLSSVLPLLSAALSTCCAGELDRRVAVRGFSQAFLTGGAGELLPADDTDELLALLLSLEETLLSALLFSRCLANLGGNLLALLRS